MVILKVTFLAGCMPSAVNVTDKSGTFIILIIIYNTVKQNGILDLGFAVSISWFCEHVTPIYGGFFAAQYSAKI
jgi:hypothetical protein